MKVIALLVLLCAISCSARSYIEVPEHAFNRVDYSRARFPNHPFFPSQRSTSPVVDAANCVQYWFEGQKIDHFSSEIPPLNKTTYAQRYFVCDAYYTNTSSSPIFFYTGNEANVELYVNHTGLMYELGNVTGALLVFAEHRYFGESLPFGAETSKYMNYLSVEQALADYAYFLSWYTQTVLQLDDPPIIGFGGSYGGMLSSWFRLAYPDSVDGIVAGSAPILAFLNLTPPYDVDSFQIIETQDATPAQGSSAECAPNVRNAFSTLFELGATAAGLKQITADFLLCNPLQTMDDVYNLANWLKSGWDFMAMGNYPYPTDYITNGNGILPAFPVRVACNTILNITSPDTTELFTAMREAVAIFYNATGQFTCFDINQSVNNATLIDGIYWTYLACTEIFIPSGQNGVTDMFWNAPFDLDAEIESCKEMWGIEPKVYWIPETYGGYTALHEATNMFFSNGMLDPWNGGGVRQNMSATVVASFMADCAHHVDLMFPNPLDPPSVIATRQLELENVKAWIQEKLNSKK